MWFTIQGREVMFDPTRFYRSIEVPSALPDEVTTPEQIAPLRSKLKEMEEFGNTYAKAKPLLAQSCESLSDHIGKFDSGMLRYEAKWIEKDKYAQIQKELETKKQQKRKDVEAQRLRDKQIAEKQVKDREAAALREKQLAERQVRESEETALREKQLAERPERESDETTLREKIHRNELIGPNAAEYEKLMKQARELEKDGKYLKATGIYRSALALEYSKELEQTIYKCESKASGL